MTEFLNFLMQHWLLASLTLFVIILLINLELSSSARSLPALDPQAAVILLNHNEALLLDLRPAPLFNEVHIAGSRNLPATELINQLPHAKLSKKITLILVTASGTIAKTDLKTLKNAGFTKLALLSGGIAAWREANFPLI